MYRVLIVEDEAEAAKSLEALVRRYGKEHGLDLEIAWAQTAPAMFEDHRHHDVCLLDIDLPAINGMDAARLLRTYDQRLRIIFVTNLALYAVRGYEVDALGFIVKPATYAAVSMNLDRAFRDIRLDARATFLVPDNDNVHIVDFSTFLYAEAGRHKVAYHLAGGKTLTVRGTLRELEERLADAPVIRVSRALLVNMDMVSALRGDDLVMVGGTRLHIPRDRRREIAETLAGHLGGRR